MKKVTFFSLICLFLLSVESNAQNSDKTVQSVNEAVGAIKSLFGKKKTAAEAVVNTNKNLTIFKMVIRADVKKIACDYLGEFNLGAAVITQGLNYALIDSTGAFIVPFGRFTGIDDSKEDFRGSGFFIATGVDAVGNPKTYYINAQGKIVVDLAVYPGFTHGLTNDKKFIVLQGRDYKANAEQPVFAFGRDGTRYSLGLTANNTYEAVDALNDSVLVFKNQGLFGAKNLKNQVIIQPVFYSLRPFHDGAAIFSQLDGLRNRLFGIVTKTGKIIVQPSLPRQPDDYQDGVTAIARNDIYEYIDRDGRTFFRTPHSGSPEHFTGEFAFGGVRVLDRSGKLVNNETFLQSIGIDPASFYNFELGNGSIVRYNNDYLAWIYAYTSVQRQKYLGFYNMKTGKTLFGIPYGAITRNCLDPVAQRMRLKIETGTKDRYGLPIVIDGYINPNGEFVIIKG